MMDQGMLATALLIGSTCLALAGPGCAQNQPIQDGRASRAAVRMPPTRAGVLAAMRRAERTAGEDRAAFVLSVQKSLNASDGRTGAEFEEPPSGPLQTDERYTENQYWLLEQFAAGERAEFSPRVVGGTPTSAFLDCVAVGRSLDEWGCTGTLIAPNVVLTAGHCWEDKYSRFVFVGHDVRDVNSDNCYEVVEAIPHEDYDGATFANDICLLILDRPIEGVAPRRVADPDRINAARFVRVTGFGSDDSYAEAGYGIKREVDVGMATAACDQPGDPEDFGCFADVEFVAGKALSDVDSCNGDSGGPAYIFENPGWTLGGVVSRAADNWTRPCGDGGIYVRVDAYEGWIRDQLNERGIDWP